VDRSWLDGLTLNGFGWVKIRNAVFESTYFAFFQISEKRDVLRFFEMTSESHKTSLPEVYSPILRNEFTYFAQ